MAFMVTTCTFPALSSLQEVASSDYQNQVHVDMNNIIMPLEYIYAIFKLFSVYSSITMEYTFLSGNLLAPLCIIMNTIL